MHRMQSGGWPYSKVGRDSDLRKGEAKFTAIHVDDVIIVIEIT